MRSALVLPLQSFCIPFTLPRQFYYRMMVNDIALFTGLSIELAQCDPKHRRHPFYPVHRYRLIVRGRCSNRQLTMLKEKLQRYRFLAVALARQSARSVPSRTPARR